ncbi:MAG: hypothetical protein DHS80DRAFT_21884 [Piptocephalis tieghemiana]|nr:MAG: hypothetical protein DHS80DRAFT_21884 [Piptocephalis tieghemiana]
MTRSSPQLSPNLPPPVSLGYGPGYPQSPMTALPPPVHEPACPVPLLLNDDPSSAAQPIKRQPSSNHPHLPHSPLHHPHHPYPSLSPLSGPAHPAFPTLPNSLPNSPNLILAHDMVTREGSSPQRPPSWTPPPPSPTPPTFDLIPSPSLAAYSPTSSSFSSTASSISPSSRGSCSPEFPKAPLRSSKSFQQQATPTEVIKAAQALRARLKFAAFKSSRGWTDLPLEEAEARLALEREKRSGKHAPRLRTHSFTGTSYSSSSPPKHHPASSSSSLLSPMNATTPPSGPIRFHEERPRSTPPQTTSKMDAAEAIMLLSSPSRSPALTGIRSPALTAMRRPKPYDFHATTPSP